MLMVTRDAADVIRELAQAPGAEGVRISIAEQMSVDTPGPGVRIEVVPAPEVDDAVLDAEGAHIFLAPDAARALDAKVLDAQVEGEAVRFALMEQPEEQPEDRPGE